MGVLTVDDNATHRLFLNVRSAPGVSTSTVCPDGWQERVCLQSACRDGLSYDLAILDYQMPGLDILTLARAIQANAEPASLPLVQQSSLGQRVEAEEAQRARFTAY